MMQSTTFSCPYCGNLMGVPTDLLGQQVRCPTCQNVVMAPTAAAPAPSRPSPPEIDPHLMIEMPRAESTESIFGEDQDEDLFGGAKPKVEMPDGPALTQSQYAAYPTKPAAPVGPSPEFAATIAAAPPLDPVHAVSETPPIQNVVVEPAAPPIMEITVDPPATSELASGSASPLPDWVSSARVLTGEPASSESATNWMTSSSSAPAAAPMRFNPVDEPAERRKGGNLLLVILAPYAVIMTLIALFYFWKYQSFELQNHPLEFIPDIGRLDYPKKKDGSQSFKGPPADMPLPDRLKVKIGETLRVGDLEVTPLRVERGRFKFYSMAKSGQVDERITGKEGLILRLRVKNRSSGWAFSPTDPVFDRRFDPERHTAKPYTAVQVGDQFFYGGPLEQLTLDSRVQRYYTEGQENDDQPLDPGQERQTAVCSDPRDESLIPAVVAANEPVVWRVQLRRGVVSHRGKDVSVTAVVGVEFTSADVKPLKQ